MTGETICLHHIDLRYSLIPDKVPHPTDIQLSDCVKLPETAHLHSGLITSVIKFFSKLSRDITLGVIAADQQQRHKFHFPYASSATLQLSQSRLCGRITFDCTDMEIGMMRCSKHIIELTVGRCTRQHVTMTDKNHSLISVMRLSSHDIDHSLTIFRTIAKRFAHFKLLK